MGAQAGLMGCANPTFQRPKLGGEVGCVLKIGWLLYEHRAQKFQELKRENELMLVDGSRRASALHGTRSASSTRTAGRSVPVPAEGPVKKARTADECRVPSAAQESSAPQHRRGRVGGRQLRRSLCARGTRSMSEVSLRVWRHACTHDSLTHHTEWTACKAHVLAGAGKAVQLS